MRLFSGAVKIPASRVVVADVDRTAGVSLVGLSVQIAIGHTLVMPLHRLPDHESQNAVGDLSEFLKNTQSGDQIITVPLTNPAGAESPFFAEDDYDATGAAISSTTFTNGVVAVTVTMPSWATTGYVHATASADMVASGGAGVGHIAIGDGTTDHNEQAITTSTTEGRHVTTSYAGEITATTTFTIRFKITTNNATFNRQTIAVHGSWA